MRRRIGVVVSALCVSAALATTGSAPASASAVAARAWVHTARPTSAPESRGFLGAEGVGRIAGRVVLTGHSGLGAAAGAVCVAADLVAATPSPAHDPLEQVASSATTARMTAQSGDFLLAGLRPGTWHVYFRNCRRSFDFQPVAYHLGASVRVAPGLTTYLGTTSLRPIIRVGNVSPWRRMQIMAADGAATSPTALHLTARRGGGAISGRVTGPDGKPLKGICVGAFGFGSGGPGGKAVTKPDGSYRISSLAAGTWEVLFGPGCGNSANYLFVFWGGSLSPPGEPVHVRAGRATRGIDQALPLGGEIAGVVKSSEGSALSPSLVFAVQSTPHLVSILLRRTHSGRYDFKSMPAGAWREQFFAAGNRAPQWYDRKYSQSSANVLRLTAGEVLRNIDGHLPVGATLTGEVVTPSGAPLTGICVEVGTPSELRLGLGAQTQTNDSGDWSVDAFDAGPEQVAYAPGCGSKGDWTAVLDGATVNLALGHTTALPPFRMPPAGEIAGRVTDRSGAPLADVCVTTGAGRQAPAVTSPEGDYVLHDVAPGRTTVEFIPNCGPAPQPRNLLVQWWSGQDSAATATPVKVVAGALTTGIDATLQEGGVVAGVVNGLSLEQLGGVFLSLLPDPGPSGDIANALVGTSGAAAATAADAQTVSTNLAADGAALVRSPAAPGRFEGVGIPTGSYLLMAESFGSLLASVVFHGGAGSAGTLPFTALSVTAGATTEGANLDFPPTGTLSAHVSFPTGEAEHSVCLVLLPRSAPLGFFLAEPLRPDGTFTVSGVSAATYRLQFGPCEATNVAPATIETSVLGGATTVVDATLPVGSVISGTVTGAGRPLRGACVTATSIDGSSSLPALAVTDRQGRYRIEGLARGTYGLGASACRKSQLANSVYGSPVTIGTAQQIKGLRLELTFGGTITGTVEAATGRPVGGLCVLAFRRPGGAVHIAVSARDGSYTLSDLGAGQYTLAERPGCGSDLLWTPVYADGSLVPDGGSVVSVAAGRTTSGVDISVPRGGSISGLVTAASSAAPLSGICVVAVPRRSTGLASSFASTANGSYTISGLAPGKYRVGFASGCGADGFRTLWYRDSLSEQSATLVTVVAGTATSAIDVRLAAGS